MLSCRICNSHAAVVIATAMGKAEFKESKGIVHHALGISYGQESIALNHLELPAGKELHLLPGILGTLSENARWEEYHLRAMAERVDF